MRKNALHLLLVILLGLGAPHIARAQGQALALLSSPDTGKFPTISMTLDVYDEQGNFVPGLDAQTLGILENGQALSPSRVEQLQPPLRLIIAVNSGPALALRDSLGKSRYDKMAAVLSNWAAARPATSPDEISLTWNGGIVASRLAAANWQKRFDEFDPQLRASTPGLAALAYALDIAQESTATPHVKSAILFISPHLDTESAVALSDLTARAKQSGVRIHTWVSDSQDFLAHPGADALRALSAATQGQSLDFTGSETIIDPEAWFSAIRGVYQVSYESQIRAGGTHSLAVNISNSVVTITSNTLDFDLVLAPPRPILVAPPSQIVRQNTEDPFDLENYTPAEQSVQMLLEFPDDRPRPLHRATLFVDGQPVDENTSEPFDRFTWDLRAYQVSEIHNLSVEVEDSLGLGGVSEPVPVQVTVIQPPGGIAGLLLRNIYVVVILVVFLAGLALLWVLFAGDRLKFASIAERRRDRARQLDPVTQPVPASIEPPSNPLPKNPFPWLHRKPSLPAAYLVKLTPDGQPAPGDPVSLAAQELTFGTDPTQATKIVGDPSLSPLHARLRHDEAGHFILFDQDSVSGTWVNYEPVPAEGRALRHGDVVNFGRLTYRFVLSKPPAAPKPILTPVKEDDTH